MGILSTTCLHMNRKARVACNFDCLFENEGLLKVTRSHLHCKCGSMSELEGSLTHRVHLWVDGKRIIDFLLVIIELFSLALMAAALLSEICRNLRFLKGWVTLSANFR